VFTLVFYRFMVLVAPDVSTISIAHHAITANGGHPDKEPP